MASPLSRNCVVFTGLNQVAYQAESIDGGVAPRGVLLKTSYSCISAGTELAKLTGVQAVDFPLCLGNRAVGRVLAAGPERPDLRPGMLVLAHTSHASVNHTTEFVAPLPDELDLPEAALLAMAMVSLVGVQEARPQLGEFAVVTGAGLVGNLAAQLLELSGVRVLLVDQVPERLELAKACGVSFTAHGAPEEIAGQIKKRGDGEGAHIGLECTGNPGVIRLLPSWMRCSGRMVLVGSPRGKGGDDWTAFLDHFHLFRPHGNLTLSGAHEWKLPEYPSPFHGHNKADNARILSRLMLEGRLKVKPLLSRVFRPAEAADAYRRLAEDKGQTLGVVFDWSKE